MSIGENIKKWRMERNLSQKQLGEQIGMSQQQIGQYELGVRSPKQDTQIKIAKALGIHPRELTDNSWLENMDKVIQEFDAIGTYLKKMGFSVYVRASKCHEVIVEVEGTSDHTMQIPDEDEVVLSKDGYTATFTEAEFEELQTAAKEAIEGRFYKKVLEQQNKE